MGIDFTGFRLDTRRVGRIKRRVTTVRTREQLGSGPTRPLFMAPRASPLAQNGFLPPRSEFRPPPRKGGSPARWLCRGKGLREQDGTRAGTSGRFGGGKGTSSHYSLLFTRNSVEPTRHGTLGVTCIREGRRPKGPARKNEALVKNVALSARREHARRDTESGEAAEIFLRVRSSFAFLLRTGMSVEQLLWCTTLLCHYIVSAYTAYAERYNINGGTENVRDIIIGGKNNFSSIQVSF